MQKSYQANAQRHDNKIDEMDKQKKGLQLTGVTVAQLLFLENNH